MFNRMQNVLERLMGAYIEAGAATQRTQVCSGRRAPGQTPCTMQAPRRRNGCGGQEGEPQDLSSTRASN